jgi:hypothetical protein
VPSTPSDYPSLHWATCLYPGRWTLNLLLGAISPSLCLAIPAANPLSLLRDLEPTSFRYLLPARCASFSLAPPSTTYVHYYFRLFTSPSLYAGTITDTDDMSSSRQNVTWVEVCSSNTSLPLMSLLTCKRVCGESPHSGSSSHIFAEHGTIVCGHLVTTKMPHHNSSNCLSYGYHGRDGLVSPCLLSLLDTYVLSSLSDRPSPETSQLP